MKSYEEMLDIGIKALPAEAVVTHRFEIPKARGYVEGNKTIITNFNQMVSEIRRDKDHFLKYLTKEIAARGDFDGPRLVFNRKVSSSLINQKIKHYVEVYVLCNECSKPDTQILVRDDGTYLRCIACGAQRKITL